MAPTLACAAELRIKGAKAFPSICPYCSVGCATLTMDGKMERCLCPAGGASVGAVRAMAPEILAEWRLACAAGDFADRLGHGAPSEDARA